MSPPKPTSLNSTCRPPAVPDAISRAAWARRQALALLAAAALLLAIFENSGLDMWLAGLAYDPASSSFPLQGQWLLSKILHKAMKQASYVAVAAMLVVCWFGHQGRLAWLPRRNAWLAATGMLLIPLATTALKAVTNRHCPWDIVDFGGFAPHIGLLDWPLPSLKRGECFPAGHASAGFLWMVWGVALGEAGRGTACWALAGAVALGLLMGVGRMLQGAHFLSHTLWSLWLAWAITVALAAALRVPMPGVRPAADRSAQS